MTPRNEPNEKNEDGFAVEEHEHHPEEVADDQQQQNQRQKKKPKLFDDSGLTDHERRQIRQNQRCIQQTLRDNEYSNYDEIEDVRSTNNHVFQTSVCFTREAVLDADNVELIAGKFAKQIEKQILVPRFDALRLVQKLGQKCTNKSSTSQYFDWKFLGIEAGICYNAIPERVTFLAGALDHQVTMKAKTVRQGRVKNNSIANVVEVKPEEVNNSTNKGDADKLSAMEKATRLIRKTLKARSLEETEKRAATTTTSEQETGDHPDIDLIQFLFNPQSFTQTVENIFNFSFLIKKGEAEIGVRKNQKSQLGPLSNHQSNTTTGTANIPSGAFVAYRTFNASTFEDSNVSTAATQAVCRFTMADWRRLCQQQSVATTTFQQGDLPHRTGTKHGRKSLE